MIQFNLYLNKNSLLVEVRRALGDGSANFWNGIIKCGGLDQGGTDRDSEKGLDSRYILKLKPLNLPVG